MDAPAAAVKTSRFNRWLPYWAVLQVDLHQTLRSWIYIVWLLVSVLGTVGYMLYRFGVYQEARIVQPASILISDLLRWSVLGSIALIIALTGGAISSERGTMADSVLSRGISRYQYFMGKLHARLLAILGTFLLMGLGALVGSFFLLHEDVSVMGCVVALASILAMLAAVATCGVTFSAVFNSSVLGIAMLWMLLYGVGFALNFLPPTYPAPGRFLSNLPSILRGYYDAAMLGKLILWSLGMSCAFGLVGMIYFSRRDV
ncbi:MAG: ABC transporter permease [Gemmataceae bacterium]